jgi:hypothetical protein
MRTLRGLMSCALCVGLLSFGVGCSDDTTDPTKDKGVPDQTITPDTSADLEC